MQSGSLNNGASAVTAIAIPFGSAKEIGFACDNGRQGLPTAKLRVAVWNGHWTVHNSVMWTAPRARRYSNSATRPGRRRSRSSVSTPARSASGTWSPKLPA